MTLHVTGATAPRYRVAWKDAQNMLDEWHIDTRAELEAGVNLADDFQRIKQAFVPVTHNIRIEALA